LRALVDTVRAGEPHARAEWDEASGPRTAIALSLPSSGRERVVVGAIWPRRLAVHPAEEALLVALGGACMLMAATATSNRDGCENCGRPAQRAAMDGLP
jgi:hypothetical protein